MSVQAITWAFEQDVRPAGAKLVLIGLANYCNEKYECWPSKNTLASKCSMSKSTVCKYLRELQNNGILTVTERTADEGKQITSVIKLNIGEAVRLTDRGCPSNGQGVSVPSDRGLSDCADTNHQLEPSIEPNSRKKQKRVTYPPLYETFWSLYPRDKNMSKAEALPEWERLSPEDQEMAVASLPGFKTYCASKPNYEVIYPVRYLKYRRFENFAPSQAEDEAAWLKRLIYARKSGVWIVKQWGGMPGAADCRVPRHLLLPTDGQGWLSPERIAA